MIMKKYKIYTTKEFDKDFTKLDKSIQRAIDNEIEQLEISPYVGKSLNYKFFREKKVKNFRFYYLIYEEFIVVFLIAISDKNEQQKTIDLVKKLIPYYKKIIEEKLKN